MILHSGFRPRAYYLLAVGLNPTVLKLYSGSRPRGNYLLILGLNPDVPKSNSVFRPRGQYISSVGLDPVTDIYRILGSDPGLNIYQLWD